MPPRSPRPDLDGGPRPDRLALLVGPALVVLIVVAALIWLLRGPSRPAPAPAPAPGPAPRAPSPKSEAGYLLCTWNVENLFDDRDDPASRDEDEDWFGQHPEMVRVKVGHLADAILRLDEGRGPDILAIVEVESRRAAELLRDALNARLPSELRYDGLVHRDNLTGRRIEPALLTRLRVAGEGPEPSVDLGTILGRGPRGRKGGPHDFGIRRILEARLEADGAPLTVIVSHWTSRLTDQTDEKRSAYADALYDAFLDLRASDPGADVVLCGDFNDEPGDTALVSHLHVTGDPGLVRAADRRPKLLDLMSGRDPERFGTYVFRGRWEILDHVVCSPGLLDGRGWRVLPETLRVVNDFPLRSNTDRRPFRFGGPESRATRGYSDHFAVTVRLVVDRPGARVQ